MRMYDCLFVIKAVITLAFSFNGLLLIKIFCKMIYVLWWLYQEQAAEVCQNVSNILDKITQKNRWHSTEENMSHSIKLQQNTKLLNLLFQCLPWSGGSFLVFGNLRLTWIILRKLSLGSSGYKWQYLWWDL